MCSLNFPSVVCCCSYLKDKLHWYNRAILSLALLPPTVVLKSPEQAQRLDGIGQTCQFVSRLVSWCRDFLLCTPTCHRLTACQGSVGLCACMPGLHRVKPFLTAVPQALTSSPSSPSPRSALPRPKVGLLWGTLSLADVHVRVVGEQPRWLCAPCKRCSSRCCKWSRTPAKASPATGWWKVGLRTDIYNADKHRHGVTCAMLSNVGL